MAKRTLRRLVSYWVCCDCRECLAETGGRFQCLSCGHDTEQGAREELKGGEQYYHNDYHDSLFVAKEVTEAVDERPRARNPKRKAA